MAWELAISFITWESALQGQTQQAPPPEKVSGGSERNQGLEAGALKQFI